MVPSVHITRFTASHDHMLDHDHDYYRYSCLCHGCPDPPSDVCFLAVHDIEADFCYGTQGRHALCAYARACELNTEGRLFVHLDVGSIRVPVLPSIRLGHGGLLVNHLS